MASQVNSEFAYINLINGETVWERLRIVRNFLEDRNAAKGMKSASELKRRAILARIEEAEKTSIRLDAEAELVEHDAMQAQQQDGYVKLDAELAFLIEYERELALAAEKTRITGKTDDEMYQLNMATEVYMRNVRKIEMEQVARTMGISEATAAEAMRIPTMRKQLLNTAKAIVMQLPAGATEEQKQLFITERNTLMASGLDLNEVPLTVQEELGLETSSKLLGLNA